MAIIHLTVKKKRGGGKSLMLITAFRTLSFCISGFSETIPMQL